MVRAARRPGESAHRRWGSTAGDRCRPIARPQKTSVAESVVLLPGFIDTHVHTSMSRGPTGRVRDRHRSGRRDRITTVVDMPLDCDPVTTSVAALDYAKTRRR